MSVIEEISATEAQTSRVGQMLTQAREKNGKSLAEVAQDLRIRLPYLKALEAGDAKALPSGTYAVGFLRTYAEYLELDGDEMVRRFRAEATDGLQPRAALVFPSPVSEGRIPSANILLIGAALAVIGYGAWFFMNTSDDTPELVPALPERLSSVLSREAQINKPEPAAPQTEQKAETQPAPAQETTQDTAQEAAPAPQANAQAAPAQAEPAKAEPPKVEPAKAEPVKPVQTVKAEPAKAEPVKPEPANEATPVPEQAQAPEAATEPQDSVPPAALTEEAAAQPAAPTQPAEGTIHGAQNANARVIISARDADCWVEVREMDGRVVFSRLLRQGDKYHLPNRPGLSLKVGNAGVLAVTVDNGPAKTFGEKGQVRTIEVDSLLTR